MNDIKLFTLSNGIELIGKLVSNEPTYYIITDVRRIHVQMQPDGSHGIALIPYSPIVQDGKHRFYHAHIATECEDIIPDAFVKAYIQETSQIQIVGKL